MAVNVLLSLGHMLAHSMCQCQAARDQMGASIQTLHQDVSTAQAEDCQALRQSHEI